MAVRRGQAPSAPSVPSEEHSRRWRDIDRLLSERSSPSARRPSRPSPAAPAAAIPEDVEDGEGGEGGEGPSRPRGQGPALAEEGYAASAAKRFPSLFASVGPMEDVMMAAARLVSDEGGYSGCVGGGGVRPAPSRRAAEEAVAFLEEVEGRPDGGAEAWMVPVASSAAVRSSGGGSVHEVPS